MDPNIQSIIDGNVAGSLIAAGGVDVDAWIAGTRSTVKSFCTTWPNSCPAGAQEYESAIQKGASILAAAMANRKNGIQADNPLFYGIDTPIFIPNQEVYSIPSQGLQATYYNPSAGFVAPPGSMPTEVSPTIPAYTSPSNAQATSTFDPTGRAAGGGTSVVGTASGSGGSQGGSNTLQSTQNPSPNASPTLAALAPGAQNQKLLMVLLAVAVAIIIFGRH